MPYLQLDLPGHYPAATKRRLAEQLGSRYAEIMQTRRDIVSVGFRELGPGNLYRCREAGPEPGLVVMCDIRRGRPPDQRIQLACAIRDLCAAAFGLRPDQVVVEFTQHDGNEMYRDGGWGPDWSPAEAG
jgi:phenylpyruvate tautomerase PptA (4-oxalocrotonate tautomerase family)